MERDIADDVSKGTSPVQQRRSLIKFLYLLGQSTNIAANDRLVLMSKVASAYEKLGDYKRAAKEYLLIVSNSSTDINLHSLAINYERIGDRRSALAIYRYMAMTFGSDTAGGRIAAIGMGCLSGVTNKCVLTKPNWWDQYQAAPRWWTNVQVSLPEFSCFEDGCNYIEHNFWGKGDPRLLVKAWLLMLQFEPMTCDEKIRTLLSIRYSYSEIGDHYRAIEFAWHIPEQFSCDVESTKIALRIIATEFEMLGDRDNANGIRNEISCFTNIEVSIPRELQR